MRFAKRVVLLAGLAVAAVPMAAWPQDAAAPEASGASLPISQWQVETEFTDRGTKGGAGNTVTRIYIAPGESAAQWTRQGKEVRLKGFGFIMQPEDSAVSPGERIAKVCPGTVVGPVTQHMIGTTKAAMHRVDCPLNARTGLPLVVLTSGWNEGLDVQIKTVLFAYAPGPEDIALAEAFLLSPAAPVDWAAYPAKRETSPSG